MTNSYSTYSKQSLEIIKESNFLEKNDLLQLFKMKDELQNTFEKKQIWRTETEIEFSVLNDLKFPTNASKYWQSVREQSVFFESLVALSFDYRRNLIKIARLKEKLKTVKDEFDEQELVIDLEEAEFAKKNMEIAAKDRFREIKIWSKKKKELNDGAFDDKDVNNHQLVSYTVLYINKIFTMDPKITDSERVNLEGQLITCLRLCKEKKLVDTVLSNFDKKQQKAIKENILNLKQIDSL